MCASPSVGFWAPWAELHPQVYKLCPECEYLQSPFHGRGEGQGQGSVCLGIQNSDYTLSGKAASQQQLLGRLLSAQNLRIWPPGTTLS